MVEFRPHTLQYAIPSAGHEAPNGDWIDGGDPTWSDPIECRYEPNGKALTIALPNGDGKVYTYSYMVYLDVSETDFVFGQKVRLFDKQGTQLIELPIAGFHRGQLNMKIWL